MYRLAICCITTLPIFQINNWGSYWNRTNLMGFADPHLTARPKNHFGWKTRLELATSWTTIRRSNQLNYNHHIVARIGIEPMTFGLWLQRSNQLSYLAIIVGMEGLEPSTFRVSGEYSNQLSYIPWWTGLNLLTSRPAVLLILFEGLQPNALFCYFRLLSNICPLAGGYYFCPFRLDQTIP